MSEDGKRTQEGMGPEAPKEAGAGWPEIVGLRPAVTGVFISIRCRSCSGAFESYQPTVAGVALGRHECPRCQDVCEVSPEVFEAALDRYLPPRSFEEMVEVTEEATRIAETWHQDATLAETLTYKGMNLGGPTERYLLSYITLGLQQSWPTGKDSS